MTADSSPTSEPQSKGAPPAPAENIRAALAALALCGPANISALTAAAAAVGARESAARAFSTQSLRRALDPYIDAGWVLVTDRGFECAYGLGPKVLRSYSPQALAALGDSFRPTLIKGSYYHSPERARSLLELDVKLGLAGANVDWAAPLDQLLDVTGVAGAAMAVLREPLHGAFERQWFARFSPEQQRRLAQPFLEWCELSGVRLADFGEYAREANSVVQMHAELRQTWARIMLLLDGASALDPNVADALPASGGAAFLRRIVAGNYSGARSFLTQSFGGKRLPLLPGAAGVFQALLLFRNELPGDLLDATRLANAGARKGNLFRESFSVIKRVLALQTGRKESWLDLFTQRPSPDADVMHELIQGLCILWFKELEFDVPYAWATVQRAATSLERQRATWLSEQYVDLERALERAAPEQSIAALRRAGQASRPQGKTASATNDDNVNAGSGAHNAPSATPLRQLFQQKPAWETALGRLEGLAQQSEGPAQAAALERVAWRVAANTTIDPYLQRSTPTGWTRGRRLAIKHLLPNAPQRSKLPPEDLRVAEHARESVTQNYGYRETFHFFERSAWEALIGHPRVFLDESEIPIQVVRGTVQLVATEEAGQFCLRLHPSDLSATRSVRREGDRLVVYPVTESLERLLEVVGAGLAVPTSARERLLGAAARLAHVAPLQSTEPALVDARPGDCIPYVRLSPRGQGMTAELVVKPLGDGGPALAPGAGSPLILARIGGTPTQASRDLSKELERAQEIVRACPALDARQTGEWEWLLENAEACLALVASLTGLATHSERVRIEWPHGKPLTLRGRLDVRNLRGRVSRQGVEFLLEANLHVDADLELPLLELLRLFSEQPQQRFVKLEQGDFVELSSELRDQLAALDAARVEPKSNPSALALPPTALAALDRLLQDGTSLSLDAPSVKWRDEFAKVFDSKPRVPRGLNAELRDYQVDGFRWLARLAELGFGACLADDMGLGKTVQLIALLLHRARSGPSLVVAPTSVTENWLREVTRFAPSLAPRVYAGPERESMLADLGPRDVLITGYATLQQDAAQLQAIDWGSVVLDEAQFIKNASAQRTRAALALRAGMRVAATGTPVENHAEDLYSLFQFVQPGLLGNQATFRRRFALEDDSASGRESRRRLRQLIQPFLLRRTKAQVLAELPALTEIEHVVELSPEETLLYEGMRRSALAKLAADASGDPATGAARKSGSNKLAILAELTRLRRLCCDARLVVPDANLPSSKMRAFGELLQELVDAGHRALVFSQFVDVLKLAAAALDAQGLTYQYLDGATPPKQRATAVDAFQAGEGDAFLISLKAGGFGLNLTAADYVIHLDPWWNPAAETQATDRAHRIGQQNPVTVYRLIAKGTIEERIVRLHQSKRELAESLLADSDQAATLSSKELRALLGE